MTPLLVHLVGRAPYPEAHDLQAALVAARAGGELDRDVVLLLEHPPVITVGRRRDALRNVLAPAGVPVVDVERGGDVTWHGPGQLVAYPIVRLEGARRDLHRHLDALEDAVLGLLADLGLAGARDPRNTGVWLPVAGSSPARKVCSVGIACRRWVTWHGLALNVRAGSADFAAIRPCGFEADTMTGLVDHLAPCPDVHALAAPLGAHLCRALGLGPGERVEVAGCAEASAVVRSGPRSAR